MTTAAAGWFPDPRGRTDSYRWWDGAAWTPYLTADPAAPGPADTAGPTESASTSSHPEPQADPEPESVLESETGPGPDAGAPIGMPRGPRSMPPGYEVGRPARRGPLALVVPIAVAVAAGTLAVVMAVHAHSQSTQLLSPPPPVPSADQRVALSYDETTGVVTMPMLKVTMPTAPFTADHTATDIYGIFSDSVEANTVVQRYAKNQSWIAVVDTGVLKDELVGKDVSTTAQNAFEALVGGAFGVGNKVTVTGHHSDPLKDMPDKAWVVGGDVHYKIKGVRSTYDRVNMLIIDVGSGHYVGWLSDRPNASAPSVKKAIDASIKTIRVTSR